MPTYLVSSTPDSTARYKSLQEAMRSQSPPTLPYAPGVDCDPVDVITVTSLPVGTHITTARGRAVIITSDHHS